MRRLALVAVLAPVLAGCGSSALSPSQLRSRATQICSVTRRRTDQIATPTLPADGARFLSRGITALAPQLKALQTLVAPADLAGEYRRALVATDEELRTLRASLRDLIAGADPVSAIKSLQRRLDPLEMRSNEAWRTLSVPACGAL